MHVHPPLHTKPTSEYMISDVGSLLPANMIVYSGQSRRRDLSSRDFQVVAIWSGRINHSGAPYQRTADALLSYAYP